MMNIKYIILLLLPVTLILYYILIYNRIQKLSNYTISSWADVEVELKRRFDLIPNLISSVKAYTTYEENLFTQLAKARNLSERTLTTQKIAIEKETTATIKSLIAIAEGYPELKASENFLSLQKELTLTEDRIAASRRYYNNRVRNYNSAIITIPNNLIAKQLKLTEALFFDYDQNEENKER